MSDCGDVPDINVFARRVTRGLVRTFSTDSKRVEYLEAVAAHREHLDQFEREDLAETLRVVAARARKFANALRSQNP